MEIKGKVHLFFEQSGTFKNEFKKLGYDAYDYDIQNNFGETDYTDDLFKAIEDAYDGKPSLFDNITPDDLIMAFFPCIYFTGSTNPCYYRLDNQNYKSLKMEEKFDKILERSRNRQHFYELLYKMIGVCMTRCFRIILENPYQVQGYLHNNFLKEPTIIDKNRMERGDYFIKPTGYWFFNCNPTEGFSYQNDKKQKTVWNEERGNGGLCSEGRSMISPDYARNFICDFIIGKKQEIGQLTLF